MSSERKGYQKQHFKGITRLLLAFFAALIVFFLVEQSIINSIFIQNESNEKVTNQPEKKEIKSKMALLMNEKIWEPYSKQPERVYFNEQKKMLIGAGEITSDQIEKKFAIKLDTIYVELTDLENNVPIININTFIENKSVPVEFVCSIKDRCLKIEFIDNPPNNLSIEYFIQTKIDSQFNDSKEILDRH